VSALLSCIVSALTPPVDVGWLAGDIIAGLTVGMVLVPQSMSYATVNRTPTSIWFLAAEPSTPHQIATLPPQYGLYSAFVGTMTYCVRLGLQTYPRFIYKPPH
jgi:MFS superfamily sulfate permease-like transporter